MSDDDARRFYWELDELEQEIVEYALPRRYFEREEIVDRLESQYSDNRIDRAFTSLKEEDRLYRRGNESEYVMIERDLF